MQPFDLQSITDITELKALAYDELVAKEQAERNIAALAHRIAYLCGTASEQPVTDETQ